MTTVYNTTFQRTGGSRLRRSTTVFGDAARTSSEVGLSFTTYVAVETVDPETQPAYVNLAQFSWQTNYSATTVNGSLQLGAGSGFSPAGAGSFALAAPGLFVTIPPGPTANQAANSITWN